MQSSNLSSSSSVVFACKVAFRDGRVWTQNDKMRLDLYVDEKML